MNEQVRKRFPNQEYEMTWSTKFRKRVYTSLEEAQSDLDSFMDNYNKKRMSQGEYVSVRHL